MLTDCFQANAEGFQHEHFEAFKISTQMLSGLLKILMKLEPTPLEVSTFREKAEAYGAYMLANFEGYTFFNYEHHLICHCWQYLEKFGLLGDVSSIVCEAANALWKSMLLHHTKRSGDNAVATLKTMSIRSDPTYKLTFKKNYLRLPKLLLSFALSSIIVFAICARSSSICSTMSSNTAPSGTPSITFTSGDILNC